MVAPKKERDKIEQELNALLLRGTALKAKLDEANRVEAEAKQAYEAEAPLPEGEATFREEAATVPTNNNVANIINTAYKMLQPGKWVTLFREGEETKIMEGVPIKIAASEVYKWLVKAKWVSLLGVVGSLLVIIGSTFFGILGGCAAAVFIIGFIAFFLVKFVQEMKRLEAKYNIDSKTGR